RNVVKPCLAENTRFRPPRGTLRNPWKSWGFAEGLFGRFLARGGRTKSDRHPTSDSPTQGQTGPFSRRIPVSSALSDRFCPVATGRPIRAYEDISAAIWAVSGVPQSLEQERTPSPLGARRSDGQNRLVPVITMSLGSSNQLVFQGKFRA